MTSRKEIQRAARRLFRACLAGGKLDSARVLSVVDQIAASKPRGWVSILGAFQGLVRQEVDRRTAVVESAEDLSAADRAELTAGLRRVHGEDIAVEFRVDPSLLGGSRIRIGSDVWDGSVRTRIDRLKAAFA